MIINEELLLANGAEYEVYNTNDIIFHEGDRPQYYFQIVYGTVELNNYREDGKEFTQNILSDGQSFGESLLFNEKPYPMNAVVKSETSILKLSRSNFLKLIQYDTEAATNMFRCLADRLFYKYIMLFNISSTNPIFKLDSIMNYLKSFKTNTSKYSFLVPLTRQQLANLTGLRVETVIRTVKKMENELMLRIVVGKIYY
ncbi:Crp/Fnr family transcriptional regulator [Chryseobacterium sp. ISL-6]|uniref:Crp/Fnr family transcriptional regulator n=1 Tax=Chryseobacterium sp. ISL-6 TaxID=2819143 RepID=UPI001BE65F76|nr:Crp/Fnr family transcriptional regulator [Chryseobacterium sp. ISL-6]MBT2621240.1 Crp/Fnr family transcriptional regulator [Chryseobacterium sp. ISL-6]